MRSAILIADELGLVIFSVTETGDLSEVLSGSLCAKSIFHLKETAIGMYNSPCHGRVAQTSIPFVTRQCYPAWDVLHDKSPSGTRNTMYQKGLHQWLGRELNPRHADFQA
jgi:hypothetical protein